MSRYNTSLALGATLRGKANSRSPVEFWTSAPVYVYTMPCGHEFRSRTPATNATKMWCSFCGLFLSVDEDMPVDRSVKADAELAFEQDKGVIRERIAVAASARGLPETDNEISDLAAEFGVPIREIRGIVSGLTVRAEGPELCRAGLHEMTPDNTIIKKDGRRCRVCHRQKDAVAAARRRKAKRLSGRADVTLVERLATG